MFVLQIGAHTIIRMPCVDQNRQFTKKKKKKPAGKPVVIKKAAGGAKPDSVRAWFAKEVETTSGGKEGGREGRGDTRRSEMV